MTVEAPAINMVVVPPISMTDAILTSSNVAENDNLEWVISTAYTAGDKVMVSTVEPDIHRNFEAKINNTGNEPWLDDGTNWIDLGATNRWKMFDEGNSTQTENANSIEVEITPGQVVNSVALLNVSASTVQVIVTDPTDGEVYNTTKSLISDSGINDWYAYFFTEIERLEAVVFLDLPAYLDATIKVILSESSATVKAGVLVIGSQKQIGLTLNGTSFGIKDFSTKEQDTFGNFVIVERGFSDRVNYVVRLQTSRVDAVKKLLVDLRVTPAVWIGSETLESTITYAYFRDFNVVFGDAVFSECSIRTEGLV